MADDPGNLGVGDILVTHCDIISSDGKQLEDLGPKRWNNIVFIECMGLLKGDSPFISGEITVLDAADLYNEMKLAGDEVINLRFKTPQKKGIDFMGKVYNIDLADFETRRSITLKFCSAEKLVADQIKFNRAYREVPYSKIAEDVWTPLKEVGNKKIYAEPTKNKGSLIVNNKSPINVLRTLARTSRSVNYMGANYVFYEQATDVNEEKRVQFVSIESLVDPTKIKPTMKYYYQMPSPELRSVEDLVEMLNYKIISLPNVVTNIQRGMYAGTVISNDLIKRKIKYTTFDYDESYNDYKSVNFNEIDNEKTLLMNNKNYSKRNQSNVHFVPKHFNSFDTETNHGDEIEDTMLVRRSQLQQINAIRLQITVPGDSQRRVGEVIEVMLPAMEEKNQQSKGKIDAAFSGRYLISKIKHTITSAAGGYNTTMQIIKDSWSNPLPAKG